MMFRWIMRKFGYVPASVYEESLQVRGMLAEILEKTIADRDRLMTRLTLVEAGPFETMSRAIDALRVSDREKALSILERDSELYRKYKGASR